MVNAPEITVAQAERALALGYAPAPRRAGLAALFALDARLGDVVRATREPLVGQMKLAWWRDALIALDGDRPPAEPILAGIAEAALPADLRGSELATIAAGWEHLFADPFGLAAVTAFARDRGGRLFDQAALLLTGGRHDVAGAGEGWAMADLAARLTDAELARQVRALARDRLAAAMDRPWPRALRPLGALALLARSDLDGGSPGSPGRIARLAVHRLTGR